MESQSHGISSKVKRKTIFYVPGMISLIGLPLLALCFIPQPPGPFCVIRIYLPFDNVKPGEELLMQYSKASFYKTLFHKKVVSVDMPVRDSADHDFIYQTKRRFIVSEIERLIFTGDSTFVLKVSLNDSSTFGDFVWLLDQTLKYKIRRWMFADNSFFFVNITPERIPARKFAVPQ
jgi:hypothetical protein